VVTGVVVIGVFKPVRAHFTPLASLSARTAPEKISF
jgi:hypothetical protein